MVEQNLHVGEILHSAIWLGGTESESLVQQYKRDAEEQLTIFGDKSGVVFAQPVWSVHKPGGAMNMLDGRPMHVPKVPDHIAGPDIKMLIVQAKVIAKKPHFNMPGHRFTDGLMVSDLASLRSATRRAYKSRFPRRPPLTDAQCDTIINDMGPETAAEMTVERAIDYTIEHLSD